MLLPKTSTEMEGNVRRTSDTFDKKPRVEELCGIVYLRAKIQLCQQGSPVILIVFKNRTAAK